MKKLMYGLLISLVCNQALFASPAHATMVEKLDQKYKNVMHDMHLIKECYVKKSTTCTADERARAEAALKSLGIKAGVIIAIIGVIMGVSYQINQAMAHGPEKTTPGSRAAQDRALKKMGEMSAATEAQQP